VARHDRRGVHARGQRAVLQAAVARQSRRAERVGDGRRRAAHEQRPLQRERQRLDEAARAQLDRDRVGELVAQNASGARSWSAMPQVKHPAGGRRRSRGSRN